MKILAGTLKVPKKSHKTKDVTFDELTEYGKFKDIIYYKNLISAIQLFDGRLFIYNRRTDLFDLANTL